MIRILFFLLLTGILVFGFLWAKERWNRLNPATKKQILQFGATNIIKILKLKWRLIASGLWYVFRNLVRK
jgi:ABC-type transport system involved in cytochrome c biogenesis permease subunit